MGAADTAIAALWISGFVHILVGLGLGGTVACSDAGYQGDPPGGFEVIGYEDGRLLYTPDGGINTCTVRR